MTQVSFAESPEQALSPSGSNPSAVQLVSPGAPDSTAEVPASTMSAYVSAATAKNTRRDAGSLNLEDQSAVRAPH